MISTSKPVIKIIEQPASTAIRFRYGSEGPTAGSIPGASTTPEMRTYPTVRIEGYHGTNSLYLVVSCVTEDDYKPHPHNLVGKMGCDKGVCRVKVPSATLTVKFNHLGIQCVKRNDVRAALKTREKLKVDPFETGFRHRRQPMSINLNAVRLCFQAFSKDDNDRTAELIEIADPVVSEPIFDKKNAPPELTIFKLSDRTSPATGGEKDIILLCDKISKEDIGVRFFEVCQGDVVWDADALFDPSNIHKQTALWFRTPPYKDLNITKPVKVFVQLYRPVGGGRSEPEQFEILPSGSGAVDTPSCFNVSNNPATTKPQVMFSTTSSASYIDPGHGSVSPTYSTGSSSSLEQPCHMSEGFMGLQSTLSSVHNVPNKAATQSHHAMATDNYHAQLNERILFDLDGQRLVFPLQNTTSFDQHLCAPNGFINENQQAHYQSGSPNPTIPNGLHAPTNQQVGIDFTQAAEDAVFHITNVDSSLPTNMDCQSIPSADSQELMNILERYQRNGLNVQTQNGLLGSLDADVSDELEEIEHVSGELDELSMYDRGGGCS